MRLVALLALVLAVPSSAQTFGGAGPSVRTEDVVTWRAGGDRVRPGQPARVVLHAEIARGWRMYALGSPVGRPLAVEVVGLPAGIEAGPPRQSDPHEGYDEAFASRYPYFSEEARVVVPLAVGRRVSRGRHEVSGAVRYAVCNDSICLPPARTRFSVPLVVR